MVDTTQKAKQTEVLNFRTFPSLHVREAWYRHSTLAFGETWLPSCGQRSNTHMCCSLPSC